MILVAGMVIVGGIYLFQSGALQNLGQPPMAVAPPEAEDEAGSEEPPAEDTPDQPEPEVITNTEYIPYPVYPEPEQRYRPRPPTRAQICSREYGGSCAQECRQYGMRSRICQECISYCGPPPPEYPRPRHYEPPEPRPRPGPPRPFPRPGKECPPKQRYNWAKKKCEPVPQTPPKEQPPKPKPMPDTPPSSSPDAGTPESTGQPADANYATYYSNGYW